MGRPLIIVAGKLYVDPPAREAYLASCRVIIEQARAARGCIDFHLSADALEPGRINVYELWESGEDVERFRGAGPDPGQLAEIREASVLRYHISSTGPA